jgi:erythromycin esterase
MKKKITLFAAIILFTCTTVAQTSIENYIKANTHKIVTDNPDAGNYDDLEQFGAAIGDKRVVLLGEQSHGDAAAFLAKSRLIKYLHEKKGFNVLAFESDFIALTGGWDKTEKTKEQIDTFVMSNIFPIWTQCHTTKKLFYNYIYQTQLTKAPLQLAGFDCQLNGVYGYENLTASLQKDFLKLTYATEIKAAIDTILKYTDSLFLPQLMKDRNKYDVVQNALKKLQQKDSIKKELDEWNKMVIENLIAQANNMSVYVPGKPFNHFYRDKQMAKNIEWLALKKYPAEKIIIWAHNGHIAKNNGFDYEKSNEQKYMMGDFLFKQTAVANELYIAGITSYSGTTQWVTNKNWGGNIKKPARKSLENWIPSDYDFAFVDFLPYNQQNPGKAPAFSLKGSIVNSGNHHQSFVHYWTKIFDGVFFIRNMYGCETVK